MRTDSLPGYKDREGAGTHPSDLEGVMGQGLSPRLFSKIVWLFILLVWGCWWVSLRGGRGACVSCVLEREGGGKRHGLLYEV